MTTIIATSSNRYAAILSESQLSDDHSYLRMPTNSKKVVASGSWVISGSGWSRPSDIVQYIMNWPVIPAKVVTGGHQDMTEWIIKRIIPKISEILEKHKAIDYDKGTAFISEAEFLIATHGKVFLIDEGFGVTPIQDYFVSGSGGKLALGAMDALKELNPDNWEHDHLDIGIRAIKSAIKFDLYSSGTIRGYKSLPSGKVIGVEQV